MKNQRIAIIGAGTSGLATATLLGRQGHRVTLIERADALTPVGAGLLLQPSGVGVLANIGCLDHMLQYSHRIDALFGWGKTGRALMQVAYTHLQEPHDVFGLGVHRAALCHVLDAALGTATATRWFGCSVNSIEQTAEQAIVHFEKDQQSHQEAFDAVLVANGSASQLRPPELVQHDKQYPWGAMWIMRPLTDELASFNQPLLQQRYVGSEIMVGALPTGRTPSHPDTAMLSMFWSLQVSAMASWGSAQFDLAHWKTRVIAIWPALAPLINSIEQPSELLPATYRDVIMSRWATGRVAVIGDAAHAMSPQLGQGANMALLDAQAMAHAVATANSWDHVWTQFDAERAGSIRFYQRMSRLLTPLFQSTIPGAAMVRDLALPLSHRIPWLRRQMAETVAGRKQSWL
jgi:2-polyprenyl-6-methoxyphenol hydroxylase-like FAD-dependent oxidoreductase